MAFSSLLDDLVGRAQRHGFNLAGALLAPDYDGCQPRGRRAAELLSGCETIMVIASGGTAIWDSCGCAERVRRDGRMLTQRTVGVANEIAGRLADRDYRCRVVPWTACAPLNFAQLAELAGLGTVSPVLGQLIHPEFGPWVQPFAAILVAGRPFGESWPRPVAASFQPCSACKRPCLNVCPASHQPGPYMISHDQCADHRHSGDCRQACDARVACPVGADHRYSPAHEAARQLVARSDASRPSWVDRWPFGSGSLA